MARFLVWLSGSAFLLWLAYRFGTLRLLGQLAIIGALFVWVIFVGYLLARNWHKHTPPPAPPTAEEIALQAAAEKLAYAARYGDAQARFVEQANPQIWTRMVGEKWRAK